MTRQIETGTHQLLAHVDDAGVLRIVLNNPDRHNSLTADMLTGLLALLSDASTDDAIRAVLVRGVGDKAFASGADIGEQSERAEAGKTNPDRGDFTLRLQQCSKPVVAMIHGYCIGGGLMLAMAADIRIASDEAMFSIPAGHLGVAYPLTAVHVLVDLIGRAWATDLCLSADRIGAQHALDIGLVTRVHPKAELEAATEELLDTLVTNAPLSMAVSKLSIGHAVGAPRPPADSVIAAIDAVWASEDAAEGMEAFFQKRQPKWQGR